MQTLMFSLNFRNYCTIPSFWKSPIAQGSLFITSSGALKTSIFMMLKNKLLRKLYFTMNVLFQSSVELLSLMKAKSSVLVDVTKTTYVVIGCLSMITWNKNLLIDLLYYLDAQISRLFIPKEVWSLLSEAMTPNHSTLLVRSTISRTTTGLVSLISMLPGIQLLRAYSKTSTFMCSQEELSLIRKR